MNQGHLKRTIILGMFYRAFDSIIILIASFLAYFIKYNNFDIINKYYFFIILLILITINAFSLFKVYQGWRGQSVFSELTSVTLAWPVVILFISSFTFITKTGPEYSREWAFWVFALSYFFLIGYRIVFRKIINYLQQEGYNQKEIIIIGAGQLGRRTCQAMLDQTWAGLIPVAFFDDSIENFEYKNVRVEGSINDSIKFIEKKRRTTKPIDQVWITLPLYAQKEIETLQHALQDTATKVYFIPDLFAFNLASYSVSETIGLPVMNMSAPPIYGFSATLKRCEDIFLSLISLIFLSPLFLIVAVLIKLDSEGPVFFKQRRYGLDGKEILVWKFRSMTSEDNGEDVKQASRNDSRITKIGAFLRKSSIDELPQLINVIFGTMSIVGPRPHAVAHNEYYRTKVQGYMIRHQMRPGITGWAQVNGCRGETAEIEDMRERIQYDLEYIRNWSIFLDIQIILMTFKTVLDTKDTY